jgi:hypothetical protein
MTNLELRAAVKVDDETYEAGLRARAENIRTRHAAASPGWVKVDQRYRDGGQIRILQRDQVSGGHIANVLRSGPNPDADADLIGNAHHDIGWLLGELDRVRAERDMLLAHADEGTLMDYWQARVDQRVAELGR